MWFHTRFCIVPASILCQIMIPKKDDRMTIHFQYERIIIILVGGLTLPRKLRRRSSLLILMILPCLPLKGVRGRSLAPPSLCRGGGGVSPLPPVPPRGKFQILLHGTQNTELAFHQMCFYFKGLNIPVYV